MKTHCKRAATTLLAKSARQYRLPFDDGGSPSQPPAKHHHQDLFAALEATRAVCRGERDGYSRGGGVPVAVEIDHKTLHGDIESAGDGLDNPEIRLMGDEEGDFRSGDTRIGKNLLGGLHHGGDRMLVSLVAIHTDGEL